MSTLFIVGTPIGNMEDITLRALRVLRDVDLVLCEDTRVTRKLLSRHGITTPTLSYHQHSTISRSDKVLELLEAGKSLALVSDAGMPSISDPGAALISYVRGRFGDDVKIDVVPGPSALTSALALSGLPFDDFVFYGFPPHKKGRQIFMNEVLATPRLAVLYESTHRIERLLGEILARAPERKIVIAKELTKIHEEVLEGTPIALLETLSEHPEKKKGEFVVMITPTGAAR